MSRLIELARKYGVDKLYSHSYVDFYSELFKGRTVRRFLEIGIGYEHLMKPFVPHYIHGASLKMWEEYFPEAEIFTCDIRPDILINEGRIRSMICDQSDASALRTMVEAFGGNWDVVIDDGSHEPAHQIVTAQVLLEHCLQVYVIEDCREPERIVNELGKGQIVRFNKRPDDCLVVINMPQFGVK